MGGVIRIQPDMMQAGGRWFPVPYVLLLRDLARINAGQTLPRIPQTATEAQVRLAAERQRQLLARGATHPFIPGQLHTAVGGDGVAHGDARAVGGEENQGDRRPRRAGRLAPLPISFNAGRILPVQGPPGRRGAGTGHDQQSDKHQDEVSHGLPPSALVDPAGRPVNHRHLTGGF